MSFVHRVVTGSRPSLPILLACCSPVAVYTTVLVVPQQVQEVCQLVAVRGARLTAAAIAGMLRHLGRDDRSGADAPRNVVAVEGAVLRK